jgi:hypothetical protein
MSWSLPSVALRILDPERQSFLVPQNWMLGTNLEHFRLPFALAAAGLAVSLLTLAVGLIALVWWAGLHLRGLRLREEQAPWAMAALVSLALIASPVAWTHYQVMQYPGVALLLIYTWRHHHWAQLMAELSLAALIYRLPVHFLDKLSQHWTPGDLPAVFLWTTLPALASTGLFAMLVRRADRAAHPHEPQRRSPSLASYIHLRAATPLVRLHDGPRSPSLGLPAESPSEVPR